MLNEYKVTTPTDIYFIEAESVEVEHNSIIFRIKNKEDLFNEIVYVFPANSTTVKKISK